MELKSPVVDIGLNKVRSKGMDKSRYATNVSKQNHFTLRRGSRHDTMHNWKCRLHKIIRER